MQTKTVFTLPKETTSWHFEGGLKPDDKTVTNYVLLSPGPEDIIKVLEAYFIYPVPNFNIASIDIVYNESINRLFHPQMKLMQGRKDNSKYMPAWKTKSQGQEKQHREQVINYLKQLSARHSDKSLPDLMILPLWHGTSDDVAEHIFNQGYGIFTKNDPTVVTDEGFFGKGIYGAYEAEYSFRCYAQRHGAGAVLLLNWTSCYEAFPVIDGDMIDIRGKPGGFDQCDAHFIPVRSNSHPNTKIYYPCKFNEPHQYTEMVVFNASQFLPRYRVKLVASIIKPGIDNLAEMAYQIGLSALILGDYTQASTGFKNAHDAGHPSAMVRLHWLYSGGDGVVKRDALMLQQHAHLPSHTIGYLRYQAHFKGANEHEAQFNLGWCYQEGLGVTQDLAKAVKYYWIAARQGHRDAQFQLGVCCAAGLGVQKNFDDAIFYYQKSALQKHKQAHYLLAQCYELGLGVKADSKLAAFHRRIARKNFHPKLIENQQLKKVLRENIIELESKTKLFEDMVQSLEACKIKCVSLEGSLITEQKHAEQLKMTNTTLQNKIENYELYSKHQTKKLFEKGLVISHLESQIKELEKLLRVGSLLPRLWHQEKGCYFFIKSDFYNMLIRTLVRGVLRSYIGLCLTPGENGKVQYLDLFRYGATSIAMGITSHGIISSILNRYGIITTLEKKCDKKYKYGWFTRGVTATFDCTGDLLPHINFWTGILGYSLFLLDLDLSSIEEIVSHSNLILLLQLTIYMLVNIIIIPKYLVGKLDADQARDRDNLCFESIPVYLNQLLLSCLVLMDYVAEDNFHLMLFIGPLLLAPITSLYHSVKELDLKAIEEISEEQKPVIPLEDFQDNKEVNEKKSFLTKFCIWNANRPEDKNTEESSLKRCCTLF